MLRDSRLEKEDALCRVQPGGQIIDHDRDGVFRHGRGVRVVARQRMPIGNEVETVVGRIVLEADPVLQSAKIMADMQAACWAHAAQYPALFCFRPYGYLF